VRTRVVFLIIAVVMELALNHTLAAVILDGKIVFVALRFAIVRSITAM